MATLTVLATGNSAGEVVVGTLGRAEWEALIRRYNHRVVVSLLAMGIRCDRAHEIAQETWKKLYEQHCTGKLQDPVLPGLAIVQARFLALDARRRERLERRHAPSDDVTATDALQRVPDAAAADPERRLLSQEQATRALAAVAASSTSAQKLFKLIYAEPGIPHAEAAQRVGLSVQRVRQILCELRKSVREAIEGDAP